MHAMQPTGLDPFPGGVSVNTQAGQLSDGDDTMLARRKAGELSIAALVEFVAYGATKSPSGAVSPPVGAYALIPR
jgi:hypothetical protein